MVDRRITARNLVVLTLMVTTAILLIYSHETAPVALNISSSQLQQQPACLEGVVTVEPGGRLGNLVLEYASAAAVARRHQLRLAAPAGILRPLSRVFRGLSAQPLAQLLKQQPCRELQLTEDQLLRNTSYRLQGQHSVVEAVQWATSRRYPVILNKWMVAIEYITPDMEYLRQELKFLPNFQRKADKKLATVKEETAVRCGCNRTQVCTVGVHVRRTDYTEYMKKRFNLKQEAAVGYYREAAKAMLQDLHTECCAVAFVITSDDNSWCKQNLLPALQSISTSENPASSAFLMSSKKPEDDLCLLASCQHLIMAYGTFALTAAIISGGRTIMYDTSKHGAYKLPSAQTMASMVEHWRLIP